MNRNTARLAEVRRATGKVGGAWRARGQRLLRDVVTYIAKRVGLIPGRVWFGAANAINAKLTAQQRRNFLRFLNYHELKQFLVFDDFHKKQPARASMDVLARVEGSDAESAVSAAGRP